MNHCTRVNKSQCTTSGLQCVGGAEWCVVHLGGLLVSCGESTVVGGGGRIGGGELTDVILSTDVLLLMINDFDLTNRLFLNQTIRLRNGALIKRFLRPMCVVMTPTHFCKKGEGKAKLLARDIQIFRRSLLSGQVLKTTPRELRTCIRMLRIFG